MFLTVFTPAYNRENTIERTYQSLKRQTCKEFCWIIIDDGSTDHTRELVEKWMKAEDNGFSIEYYYKENGGLHTTYNTAIEHLNSELAVCIDSDDFMPDNAVELIKAKWEKDGSEQYGGIVGLDCDLDGNLLVGPFPNQKSISPIDISLRKFQMKYGDEKYVVRSDLYKSVAPMKSFPGEKNFNPHMMHTEIGKKYDFLILNETLCFVEYQPNGMTNSMFKQYYNSPNSFLELRKHFFTFPAVPFKLKVRNMIHLVAHALRAKKYGYEFKHSPYKGLMLLCTPPGILLAIITRMKGK